jgi:two-component system cell cycle sensor histidine kinase/response regulator CckA
VLLLDEDGIHFRHGAAPSLPPEYVAAIDGLTIGPEVGSCGTAMYTGCPVIVEDILVEPLWKAFAEYTRPTGLRACWSTPIRFRGGGVLGAFAMYYREPRRPTTAELALIDVAVNLAGIAIGRKRAEEALKRSEAKYRNLYRNTPVMMQSLDREGRLLTVSNLWLRQLGYETREEVLGRRSTDFMEPESAARALETDLPRLFETGRVDDLAYRMVRRDGVVLDMLLSAVVETEGPDRGPKALAVLTDVTQRKRVEEALRLSEERFRGLVENSSEVFLTASTEGVLTYASPSLEAVTGWPLPEALGKPLLTFFPESDHTAVKESFDRRLRGTLVTMEHRLQTRAGQIRWMRTSSRPVREGDRVVGIHAVMMDITARKLAEEQLRQSQKMEAIGRLAGGIAHDFNNLLTAINGYSSLSMTLVEPSHPVHGYLEEILKSGERAASLTRQLLAYSRKQILAPALLDLNAVVTGMQGMLMRVLGEDIQLITDLAPAMRPVRADRGQMEQVILNFAVNARDAMPGGGRLVLSTAYLPPGEDGPLGRPAGSGLGAVRLSVGDTGTGMAPEVKARLFEPFYTTKPLGKGTGLGLSVVYGIVRQSEGTVTVDSQPGKGTTFHVILPEAAGEPPAGGTSRPEPGVRSAWRGSECILLAEDEDSVRHFAGQALEALGYRVTTARNGLEAMRLLEEDGESIRLVITDKVMPEMGGDELAEHVRRVRPDLPLLFISGYHEGGSRKPGPDGEPPILWKPFGPDALGAMVRGLLDHTAIPAGGV